MVGLAGGQAVVQAAEEPAEEVALGGGVPVAVFPAAVVVVAGAGWGGDGGEGPDVTGGGEPLVFDAPVQHGGGLAAGAGDGRGE